MFSGKNVELQRGIFDQQRQHLVRRMRTKTHRENTRQERRVGIRRTRHRRSASMHMR